MSKRADVTEGAFWADADEGVALERYRTLVNTVDDGIYQLDRAGRFVAVNDVIVELTGYERTELLGEHVSLVLEDDDAERIGRAIRGRLAGGSDLDRTFEFTARTADDEPIPCELKLSLLIEDGVFEGTVGVVRDVSERKRAERALDERARQLRRERGVVERILETGPIGIVVLDRDGDVTRINERGREVLGISAAEVDAYSPSDRAVYDELGREIPVEEHPFAKTLETGEPVYDEILRVELPGGDSRWLSVSAAPVLSDAGAVERVVTTAEDVTPLKERELELESQASELSTELNEVFGRISDAFYALDEEFRFTHVNEQAEELFQRSGEELLGETLWEAFPSTAESDEVRAAFRTAMHSQEATGYERYYDDLDLWVEAHLYPSETGISVYFRDVTERKERERELTKYETIVETINDGIYVKDESGRFTMVNDAYAELTGYDREELLGEHASLVVDEAAIGQSKEILTATSGEGSGNPTMEAEIRTADGDGVPAEGTFATLETADGDREEVGVVRDVTERKRRERELEESERRYRTLAERFPNGIVTMFDADLEYTLAAGRAFEKLPVDPADLEGRSVREAWDEDTADALVPAFRAALGGEERSVELAYADREWVVHAVPITDEDGDVFAGVTIAQDITEQKARERYLEDAKEQLEAAAEAGMIGTWEWHVREDQFVAGTSMAKQFGVDPDEAREGVPREVFISSIHEDDYDRVMAAVDEAMEACGEYEAEYRVWDVDDELRWVVARGHFECDENGDPVTFPGAISDITERKRAELEREKHKTELETLFEVLPVGVVVTDRNGQLVESNKAAREIWGGDAFDDGTGGYETVPIRWADTGEPVERDEWAIPQVLDGQEVTEPRTFEIRTLDGERRIVRVKGMPITDERGAVTRAVITLADITERREYQRKLEETVEKLEDSNERLEHFAYAASHDLQEPLRMVSSYLRLIETRYGDKLDSDGEDFLAFAVDGADRMREMIDGLLAYSRIETDGDPLEPTDLDAIFEDVLADLQFRIEECDADVRADDLPRVNGDASQLRQVFQNLLSNALEYCGDEPPRVRVSAERSEALRASERSSAERSSADRSSGQRPREDGSAAENDEGPTWTISVRDEGIGIDEEDADRIFEVFQRLHSREEHEGTGIGLALCQRIVERHGGEIWVDSEPGEGTTFSFTLPAVDA